MMPLSDPRDRFFYPHHTPMKDTYCLACAEVEHRYNFSDVILGIGSVEFCPVFCFLALFCNTGETLLPMEFLLQKLP